ncbi:hypothetical protein ACWEQL_00330 [Kitasatospora sp. NPDC004240]
MPADPYATDHTTIEQDLEKAVELGFAEYVGFLAHYGARLRGLAEQHSNPEAAFLHLRAHADQVIAQLAGR